MGQRANLIVVEHGRYNLHYTHWGANTLDEQVFWGPELALGYIRAQQQVDRADGWLDTVWAEGGVLVDLDSCFMIFWGGEDLLYQIPLRRLYLELMRHCWDGWQIAWAYEGIIDLADYVDYPRERVITKVEDDDPPSPPLQPPDQPDWVDIVGSVRLTDGTLRIYPLAALAPDNVLRAGPAVLTDAHRRPGVDTLPLDELLEQTGWISGGFHLDEATRTLELWQAAPSRNPEELLAALWPDWQVTWLWDHYEQHLDRLAGRVTLPAFDREALEQRVAAILLRKSRNAVPDLGALAAKIGGSSSNVQVSPWTQYHTPVDVPLELRRQRLYEAMSAARHADGLPPPEPFPEEE